MLWFLYKVHVSFYWGGGGGGGWPTTGTMFLWSIQEHVGPDFTSNRRRIDAPQLLKGWLEHHKRCLINALNARDGHPILFSVSDTRSSDTLMPESNTDTPILFKILGGARKGWIVSDYRKTKFGGPIFDLPILLKSDILIFFSVSDKYPKLEDR
jgi:hypothetical protein